MFDNFRKAWKIAKEMNAQKSITPMNTLSSYKSDKPIWKEWSTENAIQYGYKASTWVYSCISRISKTAGSIPWKVYRRDDDGELEEIPNHPLTQLLSQPNPYMSGQDLMERMVIHLYLGGNTLLSKVRVNNAVVELWPLSPDFITPVPSQNNFIEYYEYKKDGIRQRVETEDIIHIMFIDPSNVYWGLAPLQAVARSVDTDNEMLDWQKVSLQNRAITDGVFSFKQPLTSEQWRDAREMVREQHMGNSGARTPWILGGDATWQQMSLSPAEMDFINSRNFTREEICSVFNVPPPMIGLYDNATLSNIETARKIFWLDTMIPLLEDLKSSLNLSLVREFEEGIVLDYDVSNVQAIQDNYQEKVTTAQALWGMGIPFNEINQRLQLGFSEVDGGEVGYLPLNLAISGEPSSSNDDVNVNENSYVPVNRKRESKSLGKKAWNLETEEQKEMYWKNLDQRRVGWMGKFSERLEELFIDEGKTISKSYEDGGWSSVEKLIDSQEGSWKQIYELMYVNIIEDFGNVTWDLLKAQTPSKIKDFDPWDALIQAWIEEEAAEMVVNVLDTTKDLIRNVIAEGQEEGLGVTEISRMIMGRYEGFSRIRSETIARTETVKASNYASVQSAKQTGLDPKKVWVSSRDSRVRDSHKNMDGVIVGIDDAFRVGTDRIEFPGDGNGSPENVINCRCTVSYRVVR